MTAPDYELVSLIPDLRVAVPRSLDLITHYVLKEQGDWFEAELEFVRALVRPGMHVLDIGANYGVYALTLGRCAAPSGKVWAFEPTHATAELGWSNIFFLKLDAEGEEERILEGGRQFIAANDPLCLFELKHGTLVNTALLSGFQAQGLALYRLVPGLNVLVPFSPEIAPDPFQLNLFACSPERAHECAKLSLLANSTGNAESLDVGERWSTVAAEWPYARQLSARWAESRTTSLGEEREQVGEREQVEGALGGYALARDRSVPAEIRYAALQAGFNTLTGLLKGAPRLSRFLSLARVADELGHRMLAIHALDAVLSLLDQGVSFELDEPFLSPNPRFDHVDPGAELEKWCLAATIEQLERLSHYSSFYTKDASLPRLRCLAELGFPGPEMARRLELVLPRTSA